jgi:flagellar basal-body rod protein FlgC
MALDKIFAVAGSALTAQTHRLNVTASNLANADSVTGPDGKPYRAKQVVFAVDPAVDPAGTDSSAQGVKVADVVEDNSPLKRVHDPSNPAADQDGYVSMPNVDVVEEMVNMISASRAYQTNVDMMNTAKTLMAKTLQIGQS